MQPKGILGQDPKTNILIQKGWEWGVEKTSQWGTSVYIIIIIIIIIIKYAAC